MKEFPFPDKENSLDVLKRDYVFDKIEKDQIPVMFEDAWSTGEQQAKVFLEENGNGKLDMQRILREKGIKIIKKDVDYIVGDQRYFCEYFSGSDVIKIYQKSVQLWCKNNGFAYEEGLNIILCHEYFHYLENSRIGMVSRHFQVPMIKIGKWKVGSTGIPSLSEIGANAFAFACFSHLVDDNRSEQLAEKTAE